jgi:cell division septum initiation protein DivIVA
MKEQTLLFNIEKKGYNKSEVQDFVNKALNEKKELENEIDLLRKRIDELLELNSLLESKRDLIEQTLFNAEISAKDIVENAQKKAKDIKSTAEAELVKIDERFKTKENELKDVVKRIEYLLNSQLSLIEKYNKPD